MGMPKGVYLTVLVGLTLALVGLTFLRFHPQVQQVEAYVPPNGSGLALKQHPRLYLSSNNLSDLRDKLGNPARLKSEYQAWVDYLDSNFNNATSGYGTANYAFVYAVGSIPGIYYDRSINEYGQKAKSLLLASSGSGWTSAVSYDWLYHLLTLQERIIVVNKLKLATVPKTTNPLDDGELSVRRDYIMAGLAFWGDGIDDTQADLMVSKYTTTIANGGSNSALDMHNKMAGSDGGWSQGIEYSGHADLGNITRLVQVVEAWRTANSLSKSDVYGGSAFSVGRYYPQWALYHITPNKPVGASTRNYYMYRDHLMDAASTTENYSRLDTVLSSLRVFNAVDPNMASLSEWLLQNRFGTIDTSGGDVKESAEDALVGHFLLGEKVQPKSPEQLGLPLSKKFAGLGWMVMRTGWSSVHDTMVTFMATPYSRMAGSYSNLNQGNFTIDRNGPLVINSGAGTHHGYANSTRAHNTMIFPDPTKSDYIDKYYDQGGQRTVHAEPRMASQFVPGSQWDFGGIKRNETASSGLKYDYVFADVSRAYNSTLSGASDGRNYKKIKNFTRNFLYVKPDTVGGSDVVLIFDRVETTDPKFEKRWLLHPSANPQINGSVTVEREGKWVYTDADSLVATNQADGGNGRLFLKSLLPANKKIVKIGGPNGVGQVAVSTSHEYEDAYGVQSISGARSGPRQFLGDYRVEIIPAAPALKDNFLTVLEAVDATGSKSKTQMVPSYVLSGSNLSGVRVGQVVAAFNKDESLITAGELVVDAAGSYKGIFADCQPGASYTIQIGGSSMTKTASQAGLLTFDLNVPAANTKVTVFTGSSPSFAPTITLTSPVSGQNYAAPATVTLSASALDTDGTISKVEFYSGATLINTDTVAPYSYSWSGVVSGSYSLSAKAFDNSGKVATSDTAVITVGTVVGPTPAPTPTPIPTPQPTGTAKFLIGDRVQTTVGDLNVRATPGGTKIGQRTWYNKGTILEGPIVANNVVWWKIDYDTDPDGWSGENYLEKIASESPPANVYPVGVFDEITLTGVARGWAYDPDSSSDSVIVHIYLDAPAGSGRTPLAILSANLYRPDVNQARGISGNHGFEFTVPEYLKDNRTHSLYFYAIDLTDNTKSTLLTGSPKSFNLTVAGNPVPIPTVTPTPTPVSPTPTSTPVSVTPTPTPTVGGGGGGVPQPIPTPSIRPTPGPVPVSNAARHPRTTLVNINGTIYFLGTDLRYPFPSAEVFLSWGVRFEDVVAATQGDIDMPIGPVVQPKTGQALAPEPVTTQVKDGQLLVHLGTVYVIENGLKRGVTSMESFNRLGYKLENVKPADLSLIPNGPVIDAQTLRHPRATLVNHAGIIYFIGSEFRYPFPSEAVFFSWGAKFEDVVPANETDISMPVGPVVETKL